MRENLKGYYQVATLYFIGVSLFEQCRVRRSKGEIRSVLS